MMFFKDRLKWANKYKKWLAQNPDVANTPLSVISYLVLEDWKTSDEWIPVEVKLPEDTDEVLITDMYGGVETAYYFENITDEGAECHWAGGEYIFDFDEVVAWMPTPAPYKR